MKKFLCLILAFTALISGANAAKKENTMNKTLVAYFSASGVTAKVAKQIAQLANADLYEITPTEKYTDADLDWTNKQSRSSIEMADNSSRPAIQGTVQEFEKYETVYLGFPIWWYIAPTIINTFLEQYDWTGKTVKPFFTSGGSGAGETLKYLQPSAPKANWKTPKNTNYSDKNDLQNWINEK